MPDHNVVQRTYTKITMVKKYQILIHMTLYSKILRAKYGINREKCQTENTVHRGKKQKEKQTLTIDSGP